MFEKSAGAVIFRREGDKIYYLFLHHGAMSDYLDLPKGLIKKGENELETAKREIEEETELTSLQFVEDFKENLKWFYKKEGETVYKEAVYFLAETNQKEVKISWEHKGYEWLTFQEAMKKLKYENTKSLLKKVNDFLTGEGNLGKFLKPEK